MDLNLYFVLGLFQLSSVLATGQIPLKCFLKDFNFFNVLGETSCNEVPKANSLHFGTLLVNSTGFNIDGWIFEAKNVKYNGLDDAVLDEFGFNFSAKVLQLTFHTDMVVKCDYKSTGFLHSLPVNGEGFTEVTLKNLQMGYSIPFDIKEADGKNFIELKSFDNWYNIKDKTEFKFTSLTNKNKGLGDEVHQLMNQKWRYFTAHYGKNFMESLSEKIFSVFKNYVKPLSLKDFAEC
ncbi:uncharacterized protein LOC123658229 [Melitaea cinxia]|uniref:uncharacterized protein LOC123658229 n=1 Tax=Melitaea cinxia TaxID=113334 RepID=UPI001E273867|nr:uncharacterized protein LOC123658229 [Melitaea cinxia]